MCGIAGKVYFSKKAVQTNDLLFMTEKIAHRGPDDEGVFISKDKKVGLANRRLAIIDLSEKGHQPMQYLGRYWITTNGEIYNFQEEKDKLEKDGFKFNSDCDTEVILALYHKYKEKCLDHLRGMFAFCIYDEKEHTLFLARDRLGVKPLKYYLSQDIFAFASEAKALFSQREIVKKLDYSAINEYLIYGFIPAPKTGFVNIKKLEPGHFIKIDLKNKSFIIKKYWEPPFDEKWELSEKEWCQRILDVLEESTKLRMVSDVPIGAFLSGGVDSSGVVAMMASLSKKPINTFTVTFNEVKWDESKYANKIARLYKTNHHELKAETIDFDMLSEVAYFFEEPYSDAGSILSFIINKLARKYVTVVLNGDGGDENFAGYPNRHLRIKRDVDLERLFKPLRSLNPVLSKLERKSKNRFFSKASRFLEKSEQPLYKRYLSYNQIFTDEEIFSLTKGILNKAHRNLDVYTPIRNVFGNFKGADLKDAGLLFELSYWLPDDLLAKADLMSMANSVEGRSPFLDYKMLELTGKIPFNLKVKKGEPKYILKKALGKIVPKENLYRPKRGFGIPLQIWFSGRLKKYSKSALTNNKSSIKEIIDINEVIKMCEKHSNDNDYGPKLWSLLSLELWLQKYF